MELSEVDYTNRIRDLVKAFQLDFEVNPGGAEFWSHEYGRCQIPYMNAEEDYRKLEDWLQAKIMERYPKEFVVEIDNTHSNLNDLKAGDEVRVECMSGLGTGGLSKVDKIITKYNQDTGQPYKVAVLKGGHQFELEHGTAITPPTAYYLVK